MLFLLELFCLPNNFLHTQCTPGPIDRNKINTTKGHGILDLTYKKRRNDLQKHTMYM